MIKKIFVYVLRLLAGKFGTICTEFPLKKFLPKNQTRCPLDFSAKNYSNNISCKKNYSICVKSNFSCKNYEIS